MALNTIAGSVISSASTAKNIIAATRNTNFADLNPMAARLMVNYSSFHSDELTAVAQCKPFVKVNDGAGLWISPA
ncbi:hypothetical protein HGP16_25060 [Rhizobium sp. P40RR-XXII]|uniref:hypothetical protein n=1 Tax=unclassified Rhizobium TaxID=2613769 RepID=UPI0014564598|nr:MULTISPECIES: hypothetical protein [unclassified Rhizobium]NLR88679.1 hypothetical protein [Rhizobium sp. P28RR-XV]NLS19814.1 hypothetical protein [Rhizobium sp. P40RR-XXII]